MDEQTISVRQGSTETFRIEIDDDQAVSVKLVTKADPQDAALLIDPEPSATFTDGIADLEIDGADTLLISPGDYFYQLVITYADASEVIYPGADEGCDCDDDCTLPTFRVCESLTTGAVS